MGVTNNAGHHDCSLLYFQTPNIQYVKPTQNFFSWWGNSGKSPLRRDIIVGNSRLITNVCVRKEIKCWNCREVNRSLTNKCQLNFCCVFFHSLSMHPVVMSIKSQLLSSIPEKKLDFHAFVIQAICVLEGKSVIVHLLGPIQSHTCLLPEWN